jgi:hypothetical protein
VKIVSSQATVSQSIKSPHNWEWCKWKGLPYLTCSLFKDWQHGFFTKHFQGRSPSELVEVLNPDAQVYRVRQVHGNRVLTPSEIKITVNHHGEKTFSAADAIISENASQSLWVASADCTPVLIADSQTGRVAAIHAGWRGIAQQIVSETIARLIEMGSGVENLIFALGPAISGEVYQVNEEVAAEVGKTIISNDHNYDLRSLWQLLKQIPISPILEDAIPGKVRLDLRKIITLQLEKQGVTKEKIAIAPYCTYQQPDYFFSYRRTQEKKVQWSGIISN